MKVGALIYCVLMSIFVFVILSLTVQATEYREVRAEDILKQIENGEDVSLNNSRIVGELNLSEIKLVSVPNPNLKKSLSVKNTNGKNIYSNLKLIYPAIMKILVLLKAI